MALAVEGQLLPEKQVLSNQGNTRMENDPTESEDLRDNTHGGGEQVQERQEWFLGHGGPIL